MALSSLIHKDGPPCWLNNECWVVVVCVHSYTVYLLNTYLVILHPLLQASNRIQRAQVGTSRASRLENKPVQLDL